MRRSLTDNVVDQLDLSEVFASYYGTKGQPPHHRQMMVKVWLYGYCVRDTFVTQWNEQFASTWDSGCCRGGSPVVIILRALKGLFLQTETVFHASC